MGTKVLSKEDLWCSVLGGAAMATGGGGSASSYERFSEIIDPHVENGIKFKLEDVGSIPNDEYVFVAAGVGGGLERVKREKYMRRYTSLQDWIKEMDRVFPLPSWAEIPGEEWLTMPHKRMAELRGKEPVAYMPFELSPNNYREFIRAGMRDISVVDAENTGYRAVPEVSLSTLNVAHAPIAPAVVCTSWHNLRRRLRRDDQLHRGVDKEGCGGWLPFPVDEGWQGHPGRPGEGE